MVVNVKNPGEKEYDVVCAICLLWRKIKKIHTLYESFCSWRSLILVGARRFELPTP